MSAQPILNRAFLQSALPQHTPTHLLDLPERAIQFGTGAFLRGFIGSVLDEANRNGRFQGRVVAVGSTGSGRDRVLNEQQGLFTLSVRGLKNGAPCRDDRVIPVISRALHAQHQWQDVLAVARDPNIEVVFSNTTEVGLTLHPADQPDNPRSFPARLTRFLAERGRAFEYAPERGVVVLPCELIENNGTLLKQLVLQLAERWQLEAAFTTWLQEAVPFCNTLVDRIVTSGGNASVSLLQNYAHAYTDRLYTVCEPYRLFAIEADSVTRRRIPFADGAPGIIIEPDIVPYRERKLRLLNGAHTILAPVALQCGCRTVREAVAHELTGPFLRRVLLNELVPSVASESGREFALQVLERFANPHIEHSLLDVMLQATTKIRVRVLPALLQMTERRKSVPPLMAFGFAAFLLFMREETQAQMASAAADDSADYFRAAWASAAALPDSATQLVKTVCSNAQLWGAELDRVPDFVVSVSALLTRMLAEGLPATLAAQIAPLVTTEQS